MSTTLRRVLLGVVSAATVAALTVPGAAFARGGPPDGGGGGGGGGGGETTLANNLSVPAVFVGTGSVPTGVSCDGTFMTLPESSTVAPKNGYSIDPLEYYYVQGVHKWQAQCITATSATATAAWGDNLSGDAKLKAGSPIRVEVGLMATLADGVILPQMIGWDVVKLQPDLLDRNSAYGTLAASGDPNAASFPSTSLGARVKDVAATLTITGTTVSNLPITPEINAKGIVVYGYNLRVTLPGVYTITFTFPNVEITGANAGDYGLHTVTLPITVGTGGGGGGGRPTR